MTLTNLLATIVMAMPCGTYDGPGNCAFLAEGVTIYTVTTPGDLEVAR